VQESQKDSTLGVERNSSIPFMLVNASVSVG
jgi:hypothetical protein